MMLARSVSDARGQRRSSSSRRNSAPTAPVALVRWAFAAPVALLRWALAALVATGDGGSGVTLVEWADKCAPLLPPRTVGVTIEGLGDEPRTITIERPGTA